MQINNITLNCEITGAGPALLLLHGFTGSARSWDEHVANFAHYRQVIAPDLIGHGASDAPPAPERYGMEHCVADLLALLDRLEIDSADLLGYSMGGRVALSLALTAPQRIRRLILESTSPGIAAADARASRAAADDALADAIERDGIAAFVDRWEALPLFATQAVLPAARRAALRVQRLNNRPLGLANSLRGMGTGRQRSLWERLADLQRPTLLLVGEHDLKFAAIASQMAQHMPHARLVIVPASGHTIHLEQPDVFRAAVLDFLHS